MNLIDIINRLDCEILVQGSNVDVEDGYASDLLSDVMANCPEGAIWLTLQRHLNVIAVAQLKRIVAIVVTNGGRPDQPMLDRAREEGMAVVTSDKDTFTLSGEIHRMLNPESSGS